MLRCSTGPAKPTRTARKGVPATAAHPAESKLERYAFFAYLQQALAPMGEKGPLRSRLRTSLPDANPEADWALASSDPLEPYPRAVVGTGYTDEFLVN